MIRFATSTAPHPRGRSLRGFALAAVWVVAPWAAWSSHTIAADEPPPAAFTPADISIGQPITLPGQPLAPREPATRQHAPQPATTTAHPGSGWLGITLAASDAPGRWQVDAVAAGGPAARAGVAAGDEVWAVNGLQLESLEAASQAVTEIAAGQHVKIAIARGGQVRDVLVVAEPRPAAPAARGWQGADRADAAPASAEAQPAPRANLPPLPAPVAADLLPPPGAAAYAAAPPPFEAAGPASAGVPLPAPSAFAPALPASPTSPAPPAGGGGSAGRGRTALGVRTLPIDPGMQARFRLPDASGAYVIGVVQDLPASKGGVPPGSVIVALDDRPVRSPVELTQLVMSGPVDRPITVQFVLPGGDAKRAQVVLQPLETPLEQALVGPPPLAPRSPPAPRTSEKPLPAAAAGEVIEEIRTLRLRLDGLERRLRGAAFP